jgi:hypothetical protein
MSTEAIPRIQAAPGLDKVEWLQDILTCLPDEATRQRFLLRLNSFTNVSPKDPLFGTLDAMGLLTLAFRDLVTRFGSTTVEFRGVQARVRESVDIAERNLKSVVSAAGHDTQQLLEDVRKELREAISSEAIVKAYDEETRKQFGLVVQGLMQKQLETATALITAQMEKWVEDSVQRSVQQVNVALAAATKDFRVRLYGAWSGLLWAMLGGGAIAALGLFFCGYWLGRH